MEQNENESKNSNKQQPDMFSELANSPEQNDVHAPDALRPTLLARLGLNGTSPSLLGSSSTDQLVEAMKSSRWQERIAALQALTASENDVPLEPLLAALHDEDMNVRAAAVWALGHVGKTIPEVHLKSALTDPAWLVREAAVVVVGEMGQHIPTTYLERALLDENEFVREAAALFPFQAEAPISSIFPDFNAVASETAYSQTLSHNAMERVKKWFAFANNTHPDRTQREDMYLDHDNEITIMPLDDENSDRQTRNSQDGTQATKPRIQKRRMLEGTVAVLIVLSIVFSWFAVTQKLHPSTASQPAQSSANLQAKSAPVLFRYKYQPQYYQGNPYPAQWATENGNTYIVFGHDNGISNNGVIAYDWNTTTKQLTHMLIKPVGNVPTNPQDIFWMWLRAGNTTYIVYTSQHGQIQIWDAVTGHMALSYNSGTSTFPTWSFCNDGTLIALNSGVDGNVTIQRISTGKVTAVDHESLQKILYLQWSADDQYLAGVSTAQGLRVWNVSTGKVSLAINNTPTKNIDTISWAPEDPRIVVAYQDAPMQTWNAITGKLMISYNVEGPYRLLWSNDGIHIITAINSDNNLAQVWDSYTGSLIAKLSIPGVTWKSMLLSNNGKYLAFNTGDAPTGNDIISILDMQTGQTILTYKGNPTNAQLLVVAWSPDDQLIATAANNGHVLVWNPHNGKTITTFDTHYQGGPWLNWSPDGKMLLYTTDTTVQVLQIR
jgi:WD40 repeat protein